MIVAVDVGGTKTFVGFFNHDKGLIHQSRFLTPADPSTFLRELEAILDDHDDPRSICVAIPGIVNGRGEVEKCGNLPWVNFPIKALLSHRYTCPIYVNNDANLGGYGEVKLLTPTPKLALYLTVSTGIGSGIIENGRISPAFSHSEAGHMVLQGPDNLENWESFASGHAIVEKYHKLAANIESTSQWKEIANNIATGLLAIIPLLQPNIIIFGGSVGSYYSHFEPYLLDLLPRYLQPYVDVPELKRANHPQEAVIYGCYEYSIDQ